MVAVSGAPARVIGAEIRPGAPPPRKPAPELGGFGRCLPPSLKALADKQGLVPLYPYNLARDQGRWDREEVGLRIQIAVFEGVRPVFGSVGSH